MSEPMNTQQAPFPDELTTLVDHCDYRRGWTVRLRDIVRDPPTTHAGEGRGLTLVITTDTVNSYPPHEPLRVNHYFIVPAATWNRASWMRWLFERFHDVELHECMEFFTIDGEKPFAPNHGPGFDPYTVTQLTTDLDRRTSFTGEVDRPNNRISATAGQHRPLSQRVCVCGADLTEDGYCTAVHE